MIRLVPTSEGPSPRPATLDPRLVVRMAIRDALEAVENKADPQLHIGPLLALQPSLVDAILEDERIGRPESVSRLRTSLGLDPDPWSEVVERITALDARACDSSERLRLAATLLIGETEGLPAAVTALCHHPHAAQLVAALHAVAHHGQQRRLLEGQLIRMRRNGCSVEPPFLLNRRDSAFHDAFIDGDVLVLIYREYPGVFIVFAMQVGVGIEDLVVRPVTSERELNEVLAARRPERREPQGADGCRAIVAAAIARLGETTPSQAWLSLGHIVEERLFGAAGNTDGFVIGELQARVLVDRFARVLTRGEEELLVQLVAPSTKADTLLDLFGTRYLKHTLGLRVGVGRLDVSMEQIGRQTAEAIVTGRTDAGVVLTSTRLHLVQSSDGWLIRDIVATGIGPEDRMYGPIWDRLSNIRPLPFRDFDALSEAEQELCAGLLDEGCRLDEIAAAVLICRDANLVEDAGVVAAASHAAYEYANGRPCALHPLCERYAADPVEVAMLLERMTSSLDLTPEDPRYAVQD
ncbi:MAG TPA: hypothetical protein QGF58_07040 [Myxococcota bacterium]|nr:hypothetical protein [Myxococcota bacterium]